MSKRSRFMPPFARHRLLYEDAKPKTLPRVVEEALASKPEPNPEPAPEAVEKGGDGEEKVEPSKEETSPDTPKKWSTNMRKGELVKFLPEDSPLTEKDSKRKIVQALRAMDRAN